MVISPTVTIAFGSKPIISLVKGDFSNGVGNKKSPLRFKLFKIIFVSFNVYNGIAGSK